MIQQETYSLPKIGKSDVILDILVGSKEINHLAQKHPEEGLPSKKIARLSQVVKESSSKEMEILAKKAIALLEKKPADRLIRPEEGTSIYKDICNSRVPNLITEHN